MQSSKSDGEAAYRAGQYTTACELFTKALGALRADGPWSIEAEAKLLIKRRVAKLRSEIIQKYVDQDSRWIAFNEKFNTTRPSDSSEKAETRALLKRALVRLTGEYTTIDETRSAYYRRKKKIVKNEMNDLERALRSLGETSPQLKDQVEVSTTTVPYSQQLQCTGGDGGTGCSIDQFNTTRPSDSSEKAETRALLKRALVRLTGEYTTIDETRSAYYRRKKKIVKNEMNDLERALRSLGETSPQLEPLIERRDLLQRAADLDYHGSKHDMPCKAHRSTRRLNIPKNLFDSSDSESEQVSFIGGDDEIIGEEDLLSSSGEESYVDGDSDANSFIDDDDDDDNDDDDDDDDIDGVCIIENDSADPFENITLDLAKFKSSKGLTDEDADRATEELHKITEARHKRDAARRPTSFQQLYRIAQLPNDAPPEAAFTTNAIRFFERSIASEQRRLAGLERELASVSSTIEMADASDWKKYTRAQRQLVEKIRQTKQKIRERETNLRYIKKGDD